MSFFKSVWHTCDSHTHVFSQVNFSFARSKKTRKLTCEKTHLLENSHVIHTLWEKCVNHMRFTHSFSHKWVLSISRCLGSEFSHSVRFTCDSHTVFSLVSFPRKLENSLVSRLSFLTDSHTAFSPVSFLTREFSRFLEFFLSFFFLTHSYMCDMIHTSLIHTCVTWFICVTRSTHVRFTRTRLLAPRFTRTRFLAPSPCGPWLVSTWRIFSTDSLSLREMDKDSLKEKKSKTQSLRL